MGASPTEATIVICVIHSMKPRRTKPHGNKKLNIRERKLGRERAWGLFWRQAQRIEIDPQQRSRQYLYVLIHELCHMALPDLTEEAVVRISKLIAKGVWQQGFRRLYK